MIAIAVFNLVALVVLFLCTVIPAEFRETFTVSVSNDSGVAPAASAVLAAIIILTPACVPSDDFSLTFIPTGTKVPSMHIPTKTLPDSLKSALAAVGYGAADISVRVAETYSAQAPANDGQRGFTMAVNLATGERDERRGSWGGSNAFTVNAVDSDDTARPLPPGFAVVQGTTGYPRTFATLIIHPSNAAPLLPAKAELTDRQRAILDQFASLTSAGRKNEWERYPASKPSDSEIAELVAAGMLKQNKAGALSITTEGKNNRGRSL